MGHAIYSDFLFSIASQQQSKYHRSLQDNNMADSLSELNRICQKPGYKITGNWYVWNTATDTLTC